MRRTDAPPPRAAPHAVLFDLDDTLIHAHARPFEAWLAVTTALADRLGPVGPARTAEAIHAYAQTFWSDAERHRVQRQNIDQARLRIVEGGFELLARGGDPVPPQAMITELARAFTRYRDAGMYLMPQAIETLERLRAAGRRLGMITNGDGPGQRRKIDRFDLARHFDHVQIEGEVGVGKPEPRAYHHALAALDASPETTWIVGDNLQWEVAAPQALGLTCLWFDPRSEGLPPDSPIRPDRIIRRLGEVWEGVEAAMGAA